MKIHIGCGKRNFGPEWIHIDGGNFLHIDSKDIYLSCIDDNSVDIIYASHLIAYFDRADGERLMRVWHSKLKPGGILRIATPDFDVITSLNENGDFKLDNFLGPLYGKMKLNNETIYHKTVYNYDSLRDLFWYIGFEKVHLYNWRETEHAHIDDHSQAYLPHMNKNTGILISLNVEAIK